MYAVIRDPFGTVILRGELEEVDLDLPVSDGVTVRDQVKHFLCGHRMQIQASGTDPRMLFDIELRDNG
jgi:hypothetical protein